MNIFHKIALHGLMKNRSRTLVTVIGVILSAALLTGVTTFGISLLDYLARGATETYGSWHIGFWDVPEDFLEMCAQDQTVQDTAFTENIGYAQLPDAENPDKPYLFVSGYNQKAFETLPVYLFSGRLPENGSEVIVSGSLQADNLAEGTSVTLTLCKRVSDGKTLWQDSRYDENETLVPLETRTYTVVGMCRRPQYEPTSAPGYTLITRISDDAATASRNAFATLRNPRKLQAFREQIGYASVLNDSVLRFMGLSDDRLFTTLMLAVGGVVIAIIMVGSIFLIHNSFSISLSERVHQFGILLSVGATEKQLRGSVLFEGLCIGVLGIPLGMLMGLAAIRVVISAVAKHFAGVMYAAPLVLVVSLPALAAAAVIALVTILISAYIPAKKAAAVPVMDCIRQTGEIKVSARDMKTPRLAERLFGLEGFLALKNFRRNRRRYRSIVFSLVLSVVLFVSTNAFVIDLSQASETAIVFTDIDLSLTAEKMADGELLPLYNKLKTVGGVTGGGYQEDRKYTCTVPLEACTENLRTALGQDGECHLTLEIQFLDDERWRALVERAGFSADSFSGPDAPLLCAAKMDMQSNRLIELDEFTDMFTVPALELSIAQEGAKTVRLAFADFVPYDTLSIHDQETLPYLLLAAAPWSAKPQFDSIGVTASGKGMTFQSDTPAKTEAEMRAILSGTKLSTGWLLLNMSKMAEQNTNMIFIAKVFSYTFIVMISLIAAANVFNTISTNIQLRRKELAMLRSVGMSERSFQQMMNFECAFYGFQALIVGVPLSMLLSYLIYKGMYAGGADEIDFVMPWAAIGISIAGVLMLVSVTMLYAVRKIEKENIIDALRDDLA